MTPHISRIETFLYRSEVAEPVKTSFGSIPWRSVLLLRVEDSDGAEGWGEVWCNFPPYSADNKMRLIETIIAPAALGLPCDDPATAWHTLTRTTHRWALQTGEHGPIAACLAGVDLALWDLQARRRRLPLRSLIAPGCDRETVPAYASGLNPSTAPETVERAREGGFTAYKVKVAFGLAEDLATVDAVAARLRDEELLMVDANQGWELTQAREAVTQLSDRQVGWIEEPIAADSPPEHWAELSRLSSSPLAGGENLYAFDAFRALLDHGSHHVVQPDLLKWGGVTGCAAVARDTVSRGLRYCPHWLGSAVGLIASAHVLAAVGGEGMLEHDVMDNPLREVLINSFPAVTAGQLPLPEGPGIGFVPSVEQAERWLLHQNSFAV